jgi:hypothetical protein
MSGFSDLAQVSDKWWALVNTVMNTEFHTVWRICRLSEEPLGIQEGLCSMVLVSYVENSYGNMCVSVKGGHGAIQTSMWLVRAHSYLGRSKNIKPVMKSIIMKWAGHMAPIG